jgi:hypothetical protein
LKLKFVQDTLKKPLIQGLIDAYTTLNHYCQVNYLVPIEKIKPHMADRFEPTVINIPRDSKNYGIVSSVFF